MLHFYLGSAKHQADRLLEGYQRLNYGISSADQNGYLKYFLEAFDNEMQHNKISPMYIKMGFKKKYFYNDNDELEVKRHIDNYLEDPDKNFLMIMTKYMTLLSPFSNTIFNLDEYKSRFRDIRGGSNTRILDSMDLEMNKWISSQGYDYKNNLVEIFQNVPQSNYTYFGYKDESYFPNDGFFTASPFEIRMHQDSVSIIPK